MAGGLLIGQPLDVKGIVDPNCWHLSQEIYHKRGKANLSRWRTKAMELLPSLGETIVEARNPMDLWINLHIRLEWAYERGTPDESLIVTLYRYARWCADKANDEDDMITAVLLGFYEELPIHARVRADMPNRISLEEFAEFRDVFRYLLSPEDFESFEREFLAAAHKRLRMGLPKDPLVSRL